MIGEGSITLIFALLALVTALIVLLFSRRAKQKPIAEYVARGNAYSLQKNYGDAIDAYKRVAQLDPKIKEAYQRLGEIYRRLKRYPEAILSYEQVIRLDPESITSYTKVIKAGTLDHRSHISLGELHEQLD